MMFKFFKYLFMTIIAIILFFSFFIVKDSFFSRKLVFVDSDFRFLYHEDLRHPEETELLATGIWKTKDLFYNPHSVRIKCDKYSRRCLNTETYIEDGSIIKDTTYIISNSNAYEIIFWDSNKIIAEYTAMCVKHSLYIDLSNEKIRRLSKVVNNTGLCKGFKENATEVAVLEDGTLLNIDIFFLGNSKIKYDKYSMELNELNIKSKLK